tara:strand:- start:3616 stop:4239 length:624 start_codon:yes stop_codon:yes gene_type:complete
VCADSRAAEAEAAHQQKIHETYSRHTSYLNSGAYYVTGLHRTAMGLSRTISDISESSIRAQGSIRGKAENVLREYLSSKESGLSSQEGRSRTAGRKALMNHLAKKNMLEYQMSNTVGSNLARQYLGAEREFTAQRARNRQALGLPPSQLPPTLIPQTNKLTKALKIGLTIGGAIATGGSSLATSGWLATHGAAVGSAMSGVGSAIEY